VGIDPNSCDSMGLQLVHDLTQQLHGVLSWSSHLGATFTVTFLSQEGVKS
jgi:two-component sensor histidine kinase